MLGDLAAEENRFIFLTVGQRTEFAHAPFANHVARDVSSALDVISRAGGDVPQENLFGGTSAHQHGQHGFQIFHGVSVLVVFRQLHGETESHAARNNCDFMHRVSAGGHGGDQRV